MLAHYGADCGGLPGLEAADRVRAPRWRRGMRRVRLAAAIPPAGAGVASLSSAGCPVHRLDPERRHSFPAVRRGDRARLVEETLRHLGLIWRSGGIALWESGILSLMDFILEYTAHRTPSR